MSFQMQHLDECSYLQCPIFFFSYNGSVSQVLASFIELKEKIKEFLRLINQKMLNEMTNSFLFRTSFLSDIFSLYETNKCMQSADANKLECKEIVDAFVRKVEIRN